MSDKKGISKAALDKGARAQLQSQGLLKEAAPQAPDMEIPEGQFSEKIIYQALEENENGDAALFIKLFQGKRLYDQRANPNSAWFYWNDHHWREDEQKEVFKLLKEVVAVYNEQRQRERWKVEKLERNKDLSQEEREKQIKACKARAKELKEREKQLQGLRRITNVIKLSSMGVNSLGYVGDGWDSNPMLLGCKNGVIDFEKMRFRSGQPTDYIKTVCPIIFDSKFDCPTWKRFLFEIFEEDQELIDFLQRLLGYAITGLREEHIYPILWGEHGRNGKSTLMETLKLILGEMAYKAPTQIVMQGLRNTIGPNPALMKFRGARIVWTSEANKKDQLDTAIIKSLTGGDSISARNAYDKKEANFVPTHTPFTLVNDLPRVDADDEPFWDRVILLPFRLSFVFKPDPAKSYQRKKDPKLGKELSKELPGILNWLFEGTKAWMDHGLCIPERLTLAKNKYRQDEDILGLFLSECCFVDDGNTKLKVKPKELFKTYQAWCKSSGFNNMNQKHFYETIKKKIGLPSLSKGINYYKGVLITTNIEDLI